MHSSSLPTSPRVAIAESTGTALGIFLGARYAEQALFDAAVKEAVHAQLRAAGLCSCDRDPDSVGETATPGDSMPPAAETADALSKIIGYGTTAYGNGYHG